VGFRIDTPTTPRILGCAALLCMVGCASDEEVTWVAFNGDADRVEVRVGAEEPADAVSVALTSSTGAVEVGTGSVEPGAVAVGEVLRIDVAVGSEWATTVERVSVDVDSGARGARAFELAQDSAGVGLWTIALEAVGDPGETRTDTVTFRLWTKDEGDGT
jgi:hypothetical protein